MALPDLNRLRAVLVTRRASLAAAAVFVLTATLFVAGQRLSTYPLIHGDGHYTYLWARSLAYDGDLDLTNDYAICGDPWGLGAPLSPGLRPRNPWGIGPALAWSPLLLMAGAFAHHDRPHAHACEGPVADFAMLGSALAAAGAVWLAFRLSRRHFGGTSAAIGAAAAAVGTPLAFYATVAPSYGHALSAFAVALFLDRWDTTRGRRGWRRALVLGTCLGLAALVRPQNALLAALPAAEIAVAVVAGLKQRSWLALMRLFRDALLGATVTAALFIPQAHVWKLTYRHYLVTPQGPHFMRWSEPNIVGVLFSEAGGLLTWNPALYAALFGLGLGLRSLRHRGFALAATFVFVSMVYVNAAAWDWSGSGGFPNRRFTDLCVVFAWGLAAAAAALLALSERRPRACGIAVLGTGVVACAGWSLLVRLGDPYDGRERPAVAHQQRGVRRLLEGSWRRLGNPLSWPASVPFAAAHRAHPRQFDLMYGRTLFDRRPDTRAAVTNELLFGCRSRIDWKSLGIFRAGGDVGDKVSAGVKS